MASGLPRTTSSNSASGVPFAVSHQLCSELTIARDANGTSTIGPAKHCTAQYLPGQPFVSLERNETMPYLETELATPQLDHMAPRLWLVATPRGSHISALHQQLVRGRTTVISENPELHLVWIDGRVFIKPLPSYLLSHAFWEHFLVTESDPQTEKLARAALGFVRTYYWLIRHESDFRMGKETGLIPADISWASFVGFIKAFGEVEDAQVSARYHFGELRLNRLNFWAKFFLGKWQFHKVAWQYADYFARFYGPILFIFAFCSIVLGAMQLGVATRPAWETFASASAWFSVVTLLLVAMTLAWLLLTLVGMIGHEAIYALKHQTRKRRRHWKTARLASVQTQTAKDVNASLKA